MHRRHRRCRVRPRSRCTDRESGRRSSLPGPAPLACLPETANASACPERGSRCLPEAGPSFRPGPSTRGVFGLAQRRQSPVRPARDTPRGVSALVLSPFPACEVRERTCFYLRGETGAVAHDSRRTWRGRDLSGLPPSASELGAQDSVRDVRIVDDIMLLGGLGGSAEGGGV